jgi:general secretion pathway protein D
MILTSAATAQQPGFDPFAPSAEAKDAHQPAGVIASLEFVDTPITSIFKMISDLTGWSIVMSPQVSSQPPRINIWIKNLPPDQVLEQVATLGGLVLERKGNTIKVMTFDEYTTIYGVAKELVQLKHAAAKDVAAMLAAFAEKDKQSKILADETGNRIVLLVPKPMLESVLKLVDALDVPLEDDLVKIVPLQHREALEMVKILEKFLSQSNEIAGSVKAKAGTGALAKGVELGGPGERYFIRLLPEPKLNVILIRGLPKDVAKAMDLIAQLDVPSQINVVSYEMKYTNARDVYSTLMDVIKEDERLARAPDSSPRLRIAMSEQNNRIVIEGSPKDHEHLSKIISAVDKPLPPGTGGIRVYRLENSASSEVAAVLQNLIEQRERKAIQERPAEPAYIRRVGPMPGEGGAPMGAPVAEATTQPAKAETAADIVPPRITEAPEINSIIIKASAVEHEEFARIIHELDKPRDQVLIEVTLVTVRSDHGFDLGMELGGARLGGRSQTISFSTFGIGNVDSATGQIRLADPPPFGVNFAYFNADDFSLILNALESVGDIHITSAPKILVEDNKEAQISQLNQEPFEVASQGEQTTITSFGGFVDAGTVLNIKPHISEQDWLRLEYDINSSSFGSRTAGQLAANLPPPRREAKAHGTVRVPAEHMVVLGGLVGTREDHAVDKIPFLADVPGVGELFKNRSNRSVNETLFIFIRPVILRDPAFRDLLSLSSDQIKQARIAGDDYPANPVKLFSPDIPDVKTEEQ